MMQSWQQWAILSLKQRGATNRVRNARRELNGLDRSVEPIAAQEASELWTAVRGGVKQVVVIALGVALGELLVRFVWSYLIWQFIVQRLP